MNKIINEMEIANLSHEEKIELLKKVSSGEARIINGEIITEDGAGIVFFDRQGKLYLDNQGKYEVPEPFIARKAQKEGLIFIPLQDNEEMTGEPFPMPDIIYRLSGIKAVSEIE